MRRIVSLQLVVLLLCLSPGLAGEPSPVDLAPSTWAPEARQRVEALMQQMPVANPLAVGQRGAISGTYNAPAIYAGFQALERGGSAADAALTTAITQVALAAGSWVSYTGLMSMLYYDAASGRVFCLNADYNTVRGEDDPMSIPGANNLLGDLYGGTPSGRSVLIPGFVAGVEAAHGRFGRLPFASLWGPAIHYAEAGFEISPYFAQFIEPREDVLTRLPASRDIFTKADGSLVGEGDHLRQPALAETLRRIAAEGADYFYSGPWAEHFVAAVNAEGGKVSMADLDDYQAWWTEPVTTRYRGFDVYGYGLPATGGVNSLEALELYEASGLVDEGHYSLTGDALFWLAQISKVTMLSFLPDATRNLVSAGLDLSLEARRQEATAAAIWTKMSAGEFPLTQVPVPATEPLAQPKHSDAIVATDRWGNVAAVVHSINTVMWGKTGIFVDGISVNDSASFQQAFIAAAGPGARLPAPTNPIIVLADGKPVLASSAMGSGLHNKTLQALINVLDFDMDPKQANDAPYLMAPQYSMDGTSSQRVVADWFDPKVIERARALGLDLEVLAENSRYAQGLWVGISIDPESGEYRATSPNVTNGAAFAH